MYDTLFLILAMLKVIIVQMTKIFSLISINYFPETTPDEDNDDGFKNLNI